MIISVAVPVPLFKTFDYLVPAKNTNFPDEEITPFETGMRVLVPFAGRQLIGVIVNTKTIDNTASANKYKLKAAIKLLDDKACFSSELFELITWAAHYYCHPLGECFQTALPTALRKQASSKNTNNTLSVIKWFRTDKAFTSSNRAPKQAEILQQFQQQPDGIWQSSLKLLGITSTQLKDLEKKELLYHEKIDPLNASIQKNNDTDIIRFDLNAGQLLALEKISKKADYFNIYLLHGITGSGKTEVYIARVKATLAKKKQALILIPEINLTPQTLARFQSQLNAPIGLIHSGMSEKEKFTMWLLASNGTANIIIGTRSAIFTPFKCLDLIVVDEEHDSSYKQNDGFKYSARDLAVKRGQLENCQVILGSATPSLESLLNSKQKKYHYISLSQRAGLGEKPQIHLIDIKSRTLENGCSRPLLDKIKLELEKQNQVIIFQNRRGYSPTLLCNSCGWIALCPHCDARLTLHSRPPHLHCHHCDFKEQIPNSCKACNYQQLSPLGTGTERIETGLASTFPNTKIIRIDRDSIKKQQDMKQLVEEINRGEPCILIGTQMLAKGHDFHNVTLVAIIDADASLFSSDFRAFEQSTQLLLQVAGRAGRGDKKGTVLIQTKHAEHPLFIPILENDYDLAAHNELEERNECALPPYSKMISLKAESNAQHINFEQLQRVKEELKSIINNTGFQLSGPIEASMSRKAGIYRAYLHIFTTDQAIRYKVQTELPQIIGKLKNKTKIIIDVDPHEYI
jgi:primosomal protein N' (replication factor Y)